MKKYNGKFYTDGQILAMNIKELAAISVEIWKDPEADGCVFCKRSSLKRDQFGTRTACEHCLAPRILCHSAGDGLFLYTNKEFSYDPETELMVEALTELKLNGNLSKDLSDRIKEKIEWDGNTCQR